MEELRSTETLDREIRDDARRKAEKILKDADAECASIAASVASRIALARAEKERVAAENLAHYRSDAESRLPLEKERRIASFIDSSVRAALDAWFEGIGEDRRLALYENLLARYKTVLAGKRIKVLCAGYSIDAVGAIVARALAPISEVQVSAAPLSAPPAGFSDGFVIETEDRAVLCRVTREELFHGILEDWRQELAESLFGGRLPE
jgi:V/A-type H+-transporting ATPase subunit E